MFEVLVMCLAIFSSFCVGLWAGRHHQSNTKRVGAVIVNTDDPKKDLIRFELTVPIAEMINQKEISFSIKKESAQ